MNSGEETGGHDRGDHREDAGPPPLPARLPRISSRPLPRPKFDTASRREAYRRLARILKKEEEASELLPFDEVSRRLRLFEQSYVGVHPIPIRQIVGTVSRTDEFDRDFLPKRPDVAGRWERVERAFPEGEFPPISVYRVGDAYFVIDGHHRVAIAKQRGMEYIDAEIIELRTRWKLPADADVGKIILGEQEQVFMEESGLERARPEARIEFTRPQGYIELLEVIKVHGYQLMTERGEVLSAEEVAADWYDHMYLPAIEAIRLEGLREAWVRATDADLFLWVYQRRRELYPERGGMTFERAVHEAREEDLRRPRGRGRLFGKKRQPSRSR